MIKLNKISRLLASYIDFAIVMNLLMLVSTLANMLETKEIRLAISIFSMLQFSVTSYVRIPFSRTPA